MGGNMNIRHAESECRMTGDETMGFACTVYRGYTIDHVYDGDEPNGMPRSYLVRGQGIEFISCKKAMEFIDAILKVSAGW
jgi:hypothetical protein